MSSQIQCYDQTNGITWKSILLIQQSDKSSQIQCQDQENGATWKLILLIKQLEKNISNADSMLR